MCLRSVEAASQRYTPLEALPEASLDVSFLVALDFKRPCLLQEHCLACSIPTLIYIGH